MVYLRGNFSLFIMPIIHGAGDKEKEKNIGRENQEFSYNQEREGMKPEVPVEKERKIEIREVKEAEEERPKIKEKETGAEPIVTPKAVPTPSFKSPARKEIESIMEENLKEMYEKMNPVQRKAFKEEGEITASKIEKLLEAVKVKAKQILSLLRKWLRLIPGVNKFFLEQEAKIKADKILRIKQKEEKEG